MRHLSPILCYHKVGNEAQEGRWLCVAPEVLESHIRFLKRHYRLRLASEWTSKVNWGACLTFDDAYVSALTAGLEVLAKSSVVATFFAVSGAIGKTSEWDGEREASLANHDLLRQALLQGCEVGLHTVSHRRLPEVSSSDQRQEISECQEAFRSYGYNQDVLAYPYGAWDSSTLEAARSCQVRLGFGLGNLPANFALDLLAVPRIVVSYGDRVPMLWYKIAVRPRIDKSLFRKYCSAKNMQ